MQTGNVPQKLFAAALNWTGKRTDIKQKKAIRATIVETNPFMLSSPSSINFIVLKALCTVRRETKTPK